MRRDSTRVIFEVLSLAVSGASKTQIIFRVNLSYQLAEIFGDGAWGETASLAERGRA